MLTLLLAAGAANASSPEFLSAFYGVDAGAPGAMPLTFSTEIDQSTLDPSDFVVITRAGRRVRPQAATLNPAGEENEDRTVLIVGRMGDAAIDPPVTVLVVGALFDENGTSLRGMSQAVTPLIDGPFLVHAENANGSADFDDDGDCDSSFDSEGTIVRVTFAGGVTSVESDGGFLSESEFEHIWLRTDLGWQNPDEVGDLYDGDNILDLCLAGTRTVYDVSVDANTLQDPNGDPNPETIIEVPAL